MPNKYDTHIDYIKWVAEDAAQREEIIEKTLKQAFSGFIETRIVEMINFTQMTAFELAKAISSYPIILKPILAACNIGSRAIERDLSIKSLDTYNPRIDADKANVIAGYIKPFLPNFIGIPALSQIDKIYFIDKEIRKKKGRWEHKVLSILNKVSKVEFAKRTFKANNEQYELDAACPKSGKIKIGIDIKRIEARRDIHKRCDEIANKALSFKSIHKKSKFGAIIYYPFIEDHINIQNRLHSNKIDIVVFASNSDDSIQNVVKMLISSFGL